MVRKFLQAVQEVLKGIFGQPRYDKWKYYAFRADLIPYFGLPRRRFMRRHAVRVSIVIPSWRNLAYLHEAVESALAQTYRNVEVLVMTDVPECGAEDALRDLLPKIRFFSEPALHQAEKWNALIERAEGEAVLLLCDDDKIDATFVEKTLFEMERRGVDIVYTDLREFGARETHYQPPWKWEAETFPSSSPIPITSLCRKSIHRAVGGYADVPCTDWDFWWSAFELGAKAYHLKQPLFFTRSHASQDSNLMGEQKWAEARRVVRGRHGG